MAGSAVNTVECLVVSDPQDSLAIFVYRTNEGFIRTIRIAEIVTVSFKRQSRRRKSGEPHAAKACPDVSFPVPE
jgi:hypothetical protein